MTTPTPPTIPAAPPVRFRSQATLTQVSPPGRTLRFALDPQVLTPSPGVGGWEQVAHARREATTEWTGSPAGTLDVELLLDRVRFGEDVDDACRVLEVWGQVQPGQREPAVLRLAWGPYAAARYVLNGLSYGDARRDEQGRRLRQVVTVTLLEYRRAELALSPARRATRPTAPAPAGSGRPSSGAQPRPSGRTYTVRRGDTLQRIAAAELGRAARWPEIARLNGLRDPNRLAVGQRLRLPA